MTDLLESLESLENSRTILEKYLQSRVYKAAVSGGLAVAATLGAVSEILTHNDKVAWYIAGAAATSIYSIGSGINAITSGQRLAAVDSVMLEVVHNHQHLPDSTPA